MSQVPQDSPGRDLPHFEHLLVVMIDTLRIDHLETFGYDRPTAPFLDRLAREGRALHATSVSSWTRSSIATLLTGLPPQVHQTFGRNDVLPELAPYLPSILDRHEFETIAAIGNLNVGRRWGFDRGFDRYHQTGPDGKVDGVTITNVALGLTEDLGDERRFVYLHYVDPHDPYQPRQPWPNSSQAVESESGHAWTQPRRLREQGKPYPAAALRALIDQYDGEIVELDRELERLFTVLEERGLLEGTLVVITSDHGEEFGEHGGLTHGHTLFREVVEVPLILWSKQGLGDPWQVQGTFAQVDFMATVLDALGIETAAGVDATPPSSSGHSRWREILEGELSATAADFHLDIDGTALLARVEGGAKVIYSPEQILFFDLARDPNEQEALPPSMLPQAEPLLTALVDAHNHAGRDAYETVTRTADEETLGGLIALGYVDPQTDSVSDSATDSQTDERPQSAASPRDRRTLPSVLTLEVEERDTAGRPW